MAKSVNRFLTYAWVEYGNPLDGQAFTDGLFSMGWKNAARGFPVKTDSFGPHYVDAAHPLLPIRWRGSGLLILPNDRIDRHAHDGKPNPFIPDPIFESFRKANGDEKFVDEVRNQNSFLSEWAFSPGLKKVSSNESILTTGGDFTDYVDMISVSGHGVSGMVWGGGEKIVLSQAATLRMAPPSPRLRYFIIASCMNVSQLSCSFWLPALQRDKPIHGFFGYRDFYPGDNVGRAFFQRFMQNLRADGGTKTILNAWREAHSGAHSKIWAALIHTSNAKNDTMRRWKSDGLETPPKDGEIRFFHEGNFASGGEIFKEDPPDVTANFFMGTTKITSANNARPDVGLFAGESGSLGISKARGTFKETDQVTVVFYYFRPNHEPGMNLDTLLSFGKPPDGVNIRTLSDVNKLDKDTFTDALEVTFKKNGISETTIPYVVKPNSITAYPQDGTDHGYFNVKLSSPPFDPTGGIASPPFEFWLYREGAYLREPRTK